MHIFVVNTTKWICHTVKNRKFHAVWKRGVGGGDKPLYIMECEWGGEGWLCEGGGEGWLKTFNSTQWSDESIHFLWTPLVWILQLHVVITSTVHLLFPLLCPSFSFPPRNALGMKKKNHPGGVKVWKINVTWAYGVRSGGGVKIKGGVKLRFFTVV